MSEKNGFPMKKLVLAGLMLALCQVLPFLTGQIPQIGGMLLPMHFPVLLAGYLCGGFWAGLVGFVAPLLRFVLFGMPPIYPIGLSMAFEMAVYGVVVGLIYPKVKEKGVLGVYLSLVPAMVAGRLVWGAVRFVMAGMSGSAFPFSAFLSGAVLSAVPGIVLQLVLLPLLVQGLRRAGVLK